MTTISKEIVYLKVEARNYVPNTNKIVLIASLSKNLSHPTITIQGGFYLANDGGGYKNYTITIPSGSSTGSTTITGYNMIMGERPNINYVSPMKFGENPMYSISW